MTTHTGIEVGFKIVLSNGEMACGSCNRAVNEASTSCVCGVSFVGHLSGASSRQ